MRDLDEILGADNGGAQDQQQDLRQWVDDLGALPRVFQGREVVLQSGGVGWVIHGGLRIGNRQESCFVLLPHIRNVPFLHIRNVPSVPRAWSGGMEWPGRYR